MGGRSRLHSRQLHPAGQAADLFLDRLVHLAARFVDRGEHEVLEHLDVVLVDDLGVDLQAADLLLAVHLDLHHTAAGARLDHDGRDLGLDLLLRLRELLHQLAGITEGVHASSLEALASRTSTTRPSKRSSASCTAVSFTTSSRSFCRRSSSGGGPAGSSAGTAPPAEILTWR